MKTRRLADYPFHPVWEISNASVALGLLEYVRPGEWKAYRGVGFSCKFAGSFSCPSLGSSCNVKSMNYKFFGIVALVGLAGWWLFNRESLRVCASEPRTLTASFYGERERGRTMANGRPFDPTKFTCASWDYPLGTMLRISANGRTVATVVTDRGPNKRLLGTRQIDLSMAAFKALAPLEKGLICVTVEVL